MVSLEVLPSHNLYSILKIKTKENGTWMLILANQFEKDKTHALTVENKKINWTGPYTFIKI